MKASPTISVVTPVYNAAGQLPQLIASLRAQTDRDFEWVVTDGGSTDGTLALLHQAADLQPVISSQPDFGIYDAMNRGIKASTGEYYILTGADDAFDPDAIANFRKAIIESGADLVAAQARVGSRYMRIKSGPVWLYGQFALIAAHSLGTAIRKSLHERFGYYSRHYPIAADQLFILSACRGGAKRMEAQFVAGEVGAGGVSCTDRIGSASELFRVQVKMGSSLFVQTILFLLRLIRA